MNLRILQILSLLRLILYLAACQSTTPQVVQSPAPPISSSPIPKRTLTLLSPTRIFTSSLTVEASPTRAATLTPTPLPQPLALNAFAVAFSMDGAVLAFNSSLDGLVPEDQNHGIDAFIYQTESKTIRWIHAEKVDPLGKNPSSLALSLSANGRYLLFGEGPISPDSVSDLDKLVYLRDLKTGQDEPIDFSPIENQFEKQFSATSMRAILSPDGRYLGLEGSSFGSNIFLLNRATGAITPIGGLPNVPAFQGNTYDPIFSSDGRYLAFVSEVSSLVQGDTPCSETHPACGDVFLYEITTGKLTRIPAHLQFTQGYPYPYLTVSQDARWLAWTEIDSSSGSFNPVIRLFDRTTGKTETICAGKEPFCVGHSPSISADGRWLAFATVAATDASGQRLPDSYAQVFLYDHQSSQLTLISADVLGKPGNGDSGMISLQSEGFMSDVHISGDGRFIAFSSRASNLLPEGTQKRPCYDPFIVGAYPCYDLFLYDREKGNLNWISRPK